MCEFGICRFYWCVGLGLGNSRIKVVNGHCWCGQLATRGGCAVALTPQMRVGPVVLLPLLW